MNYFMKLRTVFLTVVLVFSTAGCVKKYTKSESRNEKYLSAIADKTYEQLVDVLEEENKTIPEKIMAGMKIAVQRAEEDRIAAEKAEAERKAAEEAERKAAEMTALLTARKIVQEPVTPQETYQQPQTTYQQPSYSGWDGQVLTPWLGVVQGPSGKETYYNLDMSGVISIMRSIGNYDEYWVRADGCKMLGNYIMVAADLSIRPRGSLVQTSLGTGIVCDTGTFIYTDPYQIDIAVTW